MVITRRLVGYLLERTDALSAAVLQTTDDQALHFLSGFGLAISCVATGFAAVILGLVAVLAALLLWIELMVRASLVYLWVAISPLGFARSEERRVGKGWACRCSSRGCPDHVQKHNILLRCRFL